MSLLVKIDTETMTSNVGVSLPPCSYAARPSVSLASMANGVLIIESLRAGAKLEGVPLTVRSLVRVEMTGVADYQPPVWTIVEFETPDATVDLLAEQFAEALDTPGWYVDFHTSADVFVVFPGKVIKYARGDDRARSEAKKYARSVGVPESQLDWGED